MRFKNAGQDFFLFSVLTMTLLITSTPSFFLDYCSTSPLYSCLPRPRVIQNRNKDNLTLVAHIHNISVMLLLLFYLLTFHVMSAWQMIQMKCQDLFSLTNKKKSAAVMIGGLRVN